jgi:hypothetical protein
LLEPPVPGNSTIAFATDTGAFLAVRRARVEAPAANNLCLNAGDRARVMVSDFDCSTASATGSGINMGDVSIDLERVRLTGFKNAVYEEDSAIRAVDLDVVCGTAPSDEQSGALHLLGGSFEGLRIRVSDCRWNGIVARFFHDQFVAEDLTLTDCDTGVAIKNGGVTLRRVAISGAVRRGIGMNGSFEMGLASGHISDLTVTESDPNMLAGVEALEIEGLTLERFVLEGGEAGLSMGELPPVTRDGVIRGATVGFVVLPPLDQQLLDLAEDIQIEVLDPLELHLPR